MFSFDSLFGQSNASVIQIAGNLVSPEFGKVAVRRVGDRLQVIATLAMTAFLLGDGEQCSVGLALDASKSMQKHYGRFQIVAKDKREAFIAKGMYREVRRDGVRLKVLSDAAERLAKENGWYKPAPNRLRRPVVEMMESLIRTFAKGGSKHGKCELLYWACGKGGSEFEIDGEWGVNDLPSLTVSGPIKKDFGEGTRITPAFRYFSERYRNSNSIFAFITDGRIDDEAEIIQASIKVARDLKEGRRRPVKCTLIGIGPEVNREQLTRLDHIEMPHDVADIDIWNANVLPEMRNLNDAWSEIFDPNTVIGTNMRVLDPYGNVVFRKTDEIKALITFDMPAGFDYFVLELDGNMTVVQKLPPHFSYGGL